MTRMLVGGILCNLPGLVLLIYILREAGRENIPAKSLRRLVIVGCLLMIPVVALQTAAGSMDGLPFLQTHPLFGEMVLNGIRLAFIEELCKFCGTAAVTWRGGYVHNAYQGMLLSAVTAFSFGLLENVLFIALSLAELPGQFWLIVLTRALIGAPGHGAYGVIMGFFYGRAREAGQLENRRIRWENLCLAVLIPGGIHSLYDWLASSQIVKIGDTHIVTGIMVALDFLVIVYAYMMLYRRGKAAFRERNNTESIS